MKRIFFAEEWNRIQNEFNTTDKAVIDSSSLIYMKKSGFLEIVTECVMMFTTGPVYTETGSIPQNITIVATDKMKADESLLDAAWHYKIPLVSEDRKLLLAAGKKGLVYFNSLMILLMLVYKKHISKDEYLMYIDRLKTVSRYSKTVWQYGESVYNCIMGNL